MSDPMARRMRDVQHCKKARDEGRAKLRARIAYEVDPTGNLPPDEREQLIEAQVTAYYQEAGRRGGETAATARRAAAAGQHPHKRARKPTRDAPVTVTNGRRPDMDRKPDPALWGLSEMRSVLARRDVSALYRLLGHAGVMQRQIAHLTGQTQSEVSEIVNGRQVMAYDVLVRIAEGLGIPREPMGLSYGAYADVVTVADPAEGDEMLRRHFEQLLALSAAAAVGTHVRGVGALIDLDPLPVPADFKGRIGSADVRMINNCVQQLRALARCSGGQGRKSVQLAAWADQWLDADCSDAVRRELLTEDYSKPQVIEKKNSARAASKASR